MGSQLSAIRGNVRFNLSDLNTTNPFWTNNELNYFIRLEYQKFYHLMVTEGEGYFETSVLLPLVANVPLISVAGLTPPFYDISALERNTTFGTVPLRPSERRFKPNYTLNSGVGQSYLPTYRMQGMNIVLEPGPTVSEPAAPGLGLKFDYVYIPTYPVFNSPDNFQFDENFPVASEYLIELGATITALESKDGIGGVADIQTFRDAYATGTKNFIDSLSRFEYPDSVDYYGQNYLNLNWWP